jgi:hypothetical protein
MAVPRFSKRGRLVLLAAFVALTTGLLLATGFGLGLMMVMPALTLAALMVIWPYPGLELLLRIAARRRPPRPRRARPPHRRRRGAVARGGRLIAASLGGRAPPALLARA